MIYQEFLALFRIDVTKLRPRKIRLNLNRITAVSYFRKLSVVPSFIIPKRIPQLEQGNKEPKVGELQEKPDPAYRNKIRTA